MVFLVFTGLCIHYRPGKFFFEARKVPQMIFFRWWPCTLFPSLGSGLKKIQWTPRFAFCSSERPTRCPLRRAGSRSLWGKSRTKNRTRKNKSWDTKTGRSRTGPEQEQDHMTTGQDCRTGPQDRTTRQDQDQGPGPRTRTKRTRPETKTRTKKTGLRRQDQEEQDQEVREGRTGPGRTGPGRTGPGTPGSGRCLPRRLVEWGRGSVAEVRSQFLEVGVGTSVEVFLADWNLSSTDLESGNALGAFFHTQPQYWIKLLDPWMHDSYLVLGWGLATSSRWTFRIFFIIFCSGERKGEFEAPGGGRGDDFLFQESAKGAGGKGARVINCHNFFFTPDRETRRIDHTTTEGTAERKMRQFATPAPFTPAPFRPFWLLKIPGSGVSRARRGWEGVCGEFWGGGAVGGQNRDDLAV